MAEDLSPQGSGSCDVTHRVCHPSTASALMSLLSPPPLHPTACPTHMAVDSASQSPTPPSETFICPARAGSFLFWVCTDGLACLLGHSGPTCPELTAQACKNALTSQRGLLLGSLLLVSGTFSWQGLHPSSLAGDRGLTPQLLIQGPP